MKKMLICLSVVLLLSACSVKEKQQEISEDTKITSEMSSDVVAENLNEMQVWTSDFGYEMLYDDEVFTIDSDNEVETYSLLHPENVENLIYINITKSDLPASEVTDEYCAESGEKCERKEIKLGRDKEKCYLVSFPSPGDDGENHTSYYIMDHQEGALVIETFMNDTDMNLYNGKIQKMLDSFAFIKK